MKWVYMVLGCLGGLALGQILKREAVLKKIPNRPGHNGLHPRVAFYLDRG